jgi:hypothetical protein
MTAGSDPQAEISTIVAQGGALRDQFVNVLLVNLDPADVMFLTRISILDMLHPQLCRIVVEEADAGERLARLARDTPVFSAARRAIGCACTCSRATSFGAASRTCLPMNRRGCMRAAPRAGVTRNGGSRRAARLRSRPARARLRPGRAQPV